jgi:excisionase family DNA binding protein
MQKNYELEDRERSRARDSLTRQGETVPLSSRLLSTRELSEVLGVSRRTIGYWTAARRIPRLRLSGRMTRFNLARVQSALERYEIKEVAARR